MAGTLRALRRRILTPNASATELRSRGFHEKSPAARDLLETIGRTFLQGYAYAAEARSTHEAAVQLEAIQKQFRGFAYEGATMGFAVLDSLGFGRGRNVARFLAGRADDHAYMAHIGIGWAMARMPRFRWSSVTAPDPLLRWLILDGFGFHQAYFHTARYVHEQYQDERFRWPADGPRWYANRAIDQGIGRALWFVGGTDPYQVTTMIEKFPAHRHTDLYSGAGLAASYAGGADADELREFWKRAGEHRPTVAQACAFAAKTRVRAGLVVPHTFLATDVFCDMTPSEAAAVTDRTRPDGPVRGDIPAYEVWRRRIADELASHGRS
jgi:enediyne biosynthesis protein E3